MVEAPTVEHTPPTLNHLASQILDLQLVDGIIGFRGVELIYKNLKSLADSTLDDDRAAMQNWLVERLTSSVQQPESTQKLQSRCADLMACQILMTWTETEASIQLILKILPRGPPHVLELDLVKMLDGCIVQGIVTESLCTDILHTAVDMILPFRISDSDPTHSNSVRRTIVDIDVYLDLVKHILTRHSNTRLPLLNELLLLRMSGEERAIIEAISLTPDTTTTLQLESHVSSILLLVTSQTLSNLEAELNEQKTWCAQILISLFQQPKSTLERFILDCVTLSSHFSHISILLQSFIVKIIELDRIKQWAECLCQLAVEIQRVQSSQPTFCYLFSEICWWRIELAPLFARKFG